MQAVRLARYHTRPLAPGAFLRRLSRLVGRRAARRRQPGAGARNLYAAARCRRRRCTSCATRRDIACVLVNPLQALHPECGRAGGFRRSSTAAAAPISTAPPMPIGCKRLRAVCSERGIVLIFDEVFVGFRIARRRRAGVFRRRGRSGDLRQDARRRPADRRAVRPQRPDEALPRRRGRPTSASPAAPSTRTLTSWARCTSFCSRLDTPRNPRALPRPRCGLGRARRAAQQRLRDAAAAGASRRICPRSGRSATRSHRATIGCCNIICAPKVWR